MIKYITGIPGSGKSYGGIYDIAINFINDDLRDKYKNHVLKRTKYKHCLTNLNEFKHDKFKNTSQLDFLAFEKIIIELHNFKMLGLTDTELEEKAKEYIFFDILIVLDEAQDYLEKDKTHLVWWLSYHRHFNQDIILITQDLPLVHKKYKVFSEFFYKAIPSSRKLFSTHMIYHKFTSYQMFKTQRADNLKLPIMKELFKFYRSGANNTQKSLVKHYLVISLITLVLLLALGYWYISSLNKVSDNPIEKNTVATNYIPTTSKKTYEKDFSNSNYYELLCNKNLCFINGNTYEKEYIFYVLNHEYDTKFLKIINYKYLILTNDKFELFKKKEIENENNNFNLIDSTTNNFNSKS